MAYRLSRNVEQSIKDYLITELPNNPTHWIYVEKAFSQIYEGKYPAILVNVSNRPERRREVGTNSLSNFVNLDLRIFAEDDGQRLDLADWLLEKVIDGISYYEYTIANGIVSEKTLAGRIVILEIVANRKELANLTGLAQEDKFRHLLSLRCQVSLS